MSYFIVEHFCSANLSQINAGVILSLRVPYVITSFSSTQCPGGGGDVEWSHGGYGWRYDLSLKLILPKNPYLNNTRGTSEDTFNTSIKSGKLKSESDRLHRISVISLGAEWSLIAETDSL